MSRFRHTERLVTDPSEIERLADRIARVGINGVVSIDTETTGFHPYAGDYITGMSLHVSPSNRKRTLDGYYIPIGHERDNADPADVAKIFKALYLSNGTEMFHHITFDWPFLVNLNLGYHPSPKSICTQIARWLQDENAIAGLKEMGEMYCDEDAGAEKRYIKSLRDAAYPNKTAAVKALLTAYPEMGLVMKSGKISTANANEEGERMVAALRRKREWGQLTPAELAIYAARDATLAHEVGHFLLGRRGITHPSPALKREMELQHILFEMTKRGVGVDQGQLQAAGLKYKAEADEIALKFEKEYGITNLGSSPQKRHLVYDKLGLPCRLKTPKGERSVAIPALSMMQGHPVVAEIMRYSRLVKARTAYAEPFASFAERSLDGRIHGKYSSDRTVTGRLAASGPNVMTIPRENKLPDIRRAFMSGDAIRPGEERYGFDLKSAELWVMASMTGDQNLIDILQDSSNRNMHTEMMVQVFGGEPDKDRPDYTIAKNVNYSMAYEAGLEPIKVYAATGGYGPAEVDSIAQRCLEEHKRMFPQQHARSKYLTRMAEELGKLPLHVPGRYRHFYSPGTVVAFYTALNALVQGGIGEFMKDVMLEVYRRGYGKYLILQVHDELVFDAPAGMEAELLALLTKISEDINPFKFVLQWDAKRWNEDYVPDLDKFNPDDDIVPVVEDDYGRTNRVRA